MATSIQPKHFWPLAWAEYQARRWGLPKKPSTHKYKCPKLNNVRRPEHYVGHGGIMAPEIIEEIERLLATGASTWSIAKEHGFRYNLVLKVSRGGYLNPIGRTRPRTEFVYAAQASEPKRFFRRDRLIGDLFQSVCSRLQAGQSMKSIARELPVSERTVGRIAHGLHSLQSTGSPRTTRIDWPTVLAVYSRLQEGQSFRRIARDMGIDARTVGRIADGQHRLQAGPAQAHRKNKLRRYMPSPETIAKKCAKLQRRWSPEERIERSCYAAWSPQVVSERSMCA